MKNLNLEENIHCLESTLLKVYERNYMIIISIVKILVIVGIIMAIVYLSKGATGEHSLFLKALSKSVVPAIVPLIAGVIAFIGIGTEPSGVDNGIGLGLAMAIAMVCSIGSALIVFVISAIVAYCTKCSPIVIKWIIGVDATIFGVISLPFIYFIIRNIFLMIKNILR